MTGLIRGDVSDGFGQVADEFRRNFTDRDELGAALTVVREGKVVVDLWVDIATRSVPSGGNGTRWSRCGRRPRA